MKQQHGEGESRCVYREVEVCPVEECSGGGHDKHGIDKHFYYRHPLAKVIIRGNGELERCGKCGIFLKKVEKHISSTTYKKGRARKKRKQEEQHHGG